MSKPKTKRPRKAAAPKPGGSWRLLAQGRAGPTVDMRDGGETGGKVTVASDVDTGGKRLPGAPWWPDKRTQPAPPAEEEPSASR